MDPINLVMLFAIILTARLGIRLLLRWLYGNKREKKRKDEQLPLNDDE